MNRYPYFPFYPNDFISDDNVDSMSTLGLGAYIRLLCKAWHQELVATLPNDDAKLAQWAKLSQDQWATVRDEVLLAFTLGRDGRLHQKRMKSEYQKLRERSKERSSAGLKGAEAKKLRGIAIAEPKLCNSSADIQPQATADMSPSSSISPSTSLSPEREKKKSSNGNAALVEEYLQTRKGRK